jgi:hypothetical protein
MGLWNWLKLRTSEAFRQIKREGSGSYGPTTTDSWSSAEPPDPVKDEFYTETFQPPFYSPGDLDDYGRESPAMRRAYLDLYREQGIVKSAIDGKANAIAAMDISVAPADETRPEDCAAAEFAEWTVSQTIHGWDGLIKDLITPSFLLGFSVGEKTLMPITNSNKYTGYWGLKHVRSIDTDKLRLRMDSFRQITGIVSMVLGMRTLSASKFIIHTHNPLFGNPFGGADLRACHQAARLIDDTYATWFIALRMFGLPFIQGRTNDKAKKEAIYKALKAGRSMGVIVTTDSDDIIVHNLSQATNFDAFEKLIERSRQEVFLAVRKAYLPYMEGSNNDARGSSKISKVASNDEDYLIAKAVGRLLTHQLMSDLVKPNFGPGVGVPRVILGGVDWAETKQQLEVAEMVRDKFGVIPSRKWVIDISSVAQATGEDDMAQPQQPQQAGGMQMPSANGMGGGAAAGGGSGAPAEQQSPLPPSGQPQATQPLAQPQASPPPQQSLQDLFADPQGNSQVGPRASFSELFGDPQEWESTLA